MNEGVKIMIVEYEKERDMIFVSKQVDDKWIQVGFTRREMDELVTKWKVDMVKYVY